MTIPPVTEIPGYPEVRKALMAASFHFAADYGEQGQARAAQRRACEIIIANRWPGWRIAQAHKLIDPIMPLDAIMGTILSILYTRMEKPQ